MVKPHFQHQSWLCKPAGSSQILFFCTDVAASRTAAAVHLCWRKRKRNRRCGAQRCRTSSPFQRGASPPALPPRSEHRPHFVTAPVHPRSPSTLSRGKENPLVGMPDLQHGIAAHLLLKQHGDLLPLLHSRRIPKCFLYNRVESDLHPQNKTVIFIPCPR